jgi:hypothetical protein
MQFTTNQRNLAEMNKQEKALRKVLAYYETKLNFKKKNNKKNKR